MLRTPRVLIPLLCPEPQAQGILVLTQSWNGIKSETKQGAFFDTNLNHYVCVPDFRRGVFASGCSCARNIYSTCHGSLCHTDNDGPQNCNAYTHAYQKPYATIYVTIRWQRDLLRGVWEPEIQRHALW